VGQVSAVSEVGFGDGEMRFCRRNTWWGQAF
jgi:hypothetical protein